MQHNAICVSDFSKPETFIKKQSRLNLVTVGSLVKKKNHCFLIPVVKELVARGVDCELHILGEGHLRKNIEKSIQKHNLQNHIFLHGNTRVQEFYWSADFYLHPALYEPFGLVLIEAMAAGLPVISLDGKGNRDIIKQGKNGFILDKKVKAFADVIVQIYNNKKLYNIMQKECIDTANSFDIKQYVEQLIQLYKN